MNTFTYLLGRPFPISFPQPLPHISSRQDAPAESTGGKQAFRNMAKMQQKLSECGLRAETNYNSRDFLRTKNRGSHRAATAGFPRTKRPCYHGNAGCRSSDLCLKQSAVLPSQVSPMTGSRQRTGLSALTAPDRAGPFTPFPFTPEVTKASPGPHPFDSHLLYHLLLKKQV